MSNIPDEVRKASTCRKNEINFMKLNEDDFTKTPIRRCYYQTAPHFDAILDDISKLRYDVDRLDEEEYQNCLSDLQAHLTNISLEIKSLVIYDMAQEENKNN